MSDPFWTLDLPPCGSVDFLQRLPLLGLPVFVVPFCLIAIPTARQFCFALLALGVVVTTDK